ncbi:hypothetical protein J4E80_005314 [Alternaria sp. BMP 0032]|nr:hypothetical protein J4E80_005314 [Alternaria sp. BMP 0032]
MVKGDQLWVFLAIETKTCEFEMQEKEDAARAKLDLLRRKRAFLAARGVRHPLNRHGASDAEAFHKPLVEFAAQLRRSNEPVAELKGEREKYGLQPGETMEQRYDELASRFKSLQAEHEGEDGNGGLVFKYDALEKNLNKLKEMHDGGDGKGGLVSELEKLNQDHADSTGRYNDLSEKDHGKDGKGGLVLELEQLKQDYADLTGRYNDLSEKYDGKDGKGGVVSELEQLKQHHGNSADRSEHLEESDRGKGGQGVPETAHGKLRDEAEDTAAQPETTQADNQELTKEVVTLRAAAGSLNRVAEALEKIGGNLDHLYRYLNYAAAVSEMCAYIKTWLASTHDADNLELFSASQDNDEAEAVWTTLRFFIEPGGLEERRRIEVVSWEKVAVERQQEADWWKDAARRAHVAITQRDASIKLLRDHIEKTS